MGARLKTKFNEAKDYPSDINEHVETFYKYAQECSHITEMGIRTVVSSWGFLKGLVDNKVPTKTLIGVDLEYHPNIDTLAEVAKNHNVSYRFIQGDSAKVDLEPTDILFIDTWHVYAHLRRELAKHHKIAKKYIIMHDTTVDEIDGESIRLDFDISAQSKASGYPEGEIRKGLWPAVEEFLAGHPEWALHERYTNNNGLTILKRIR